MIDQIHPNLLRQALQLGRNGRRALYERLECLGDRVVGLVVAEMLYTTFPDEREGALAKRFVALTREETLARVGEQIGLPERIITRDDSLRHNSSVLCDVCEAVLGAVDQPDDTSEPPGDLTTSRWSGDISQLSPA